MNRKTWTLNRRTLLQGAGAALALPWLETMSWADPAADAKAPVRMACLFMANGVRADAWQPQGEGYDYQLSRTLEPLARHRQDFNVLTHLQHKACRGGDGHYVKTSGWLTGTTITKTTGSGLSCNGISIDQLAAARLGHHTMLPSLELGTERVGTGIDFNVGYTRVYGGHVSWRAPTVPVAKEIDPALVFDRMFRPEIGRSTLDDDESVLDLVRHDASRLRRQISQHDRRKLDEYLESVRALEQRIERAQAQELEAWNPQDQAPGMARPAGIPKSHADHVRLMLDLMVLAFQTDQTRITTFMFGNSVSTVNFSFLDGVRGAHHEISHHQNDAEKLAQYEKINRWHVEQVAYLLDRLKSIRERDGKTLLDHSMILFGSGMRDGNSHDPNNLPLILAGRGGGALQTGRHVVSPAGTPMTNLFVTMLRTFGVEIDTFADSTGPLALG
jgi:hypothetical protein